MNSVHAERNAIEKLPSKKKISDINLLVIRFSKNGKICMSKPCTKCIDYMLNYPCKRGYNIKTIYYSDENGNIIKTNLSKLKET
jgi:cytidine deaminase